MANNNGWFRNYVMSFSYKERRAKKLEEYKKRVHELKNMESVEIDFEYINLKSEYEHKKSILTIFIISIALSVLMNVWEKFFLFMEKALTYAVSFQEGEIEVAKISFLISLFVAVFLTVIILYIILTYMKKIKQIQKELMIIEEVRNRRSGGI